MLLFEVLIPGSGQLYSRQWIFGGIKLGLFLSFLIISFYIKKQILIPKCCIIVKKALLGGDKDDKKDDKKEDKKDDKKEIVNDNPNEIVEVNEQNQLNEQKKQNEDSKNILRHSNTIAPQNRVNPLNVLQKITPNEKGEIFLNSIEIPEEVKNESFCEGFFIASIPKENGKVEEGSDKFKSDCGHHDCSSLLAMQPEIIYRYPEKDTKELEINKLK